MRHTVRYAASVSEPDTYTALTHSEFCFCGWKDLESAEADVECDRCVSMSDKAQSSPSTSFRSTLRTLRILKTRNSYLQNSQVQKLTLRMNSDLKKKSNVLFVTARGGFFLFLAKSPAAYTRSAT